MNDMDIEAVCNMPEDGSVDFNDLFSDDKGGLIKSLSGNEYDAVLLKAIVDKQIATKTFDYDGEKMECDAAPALLEKLNNEIAVQKEQLQKHEEKIVSFFYHTAKRQSPEAAATLKEKYLAYFENRKKAESFLNAGQRIMNLMKPLFAGQSVEISAAEMMARSLKDETETIKPLISNWITLGLYKNEIQKKAEDFLQADYHYFSNGSFFDNELTTLHLLANETANGIAVFQLKQFKEILEYQLELLHNN